MTHRAKITASINKYMNLARKAYPNAHLPDPAITFDYPGGRTFGQAQYGPSHFKIRINDNISAKYLDDAVNTTAPHEVAHLVAYKVHGSCQGHNANWKRIMRRFGVAPDTYADASLDTLEFRNFKAQTKYHYHCGNAACVHKMSSKRHKNIQLGATRVCRTTRGTIDAGNFIKAVRMTGAQRKAEAYAKAGKALPGAKVPEPAKARKAPQARKSHNPPTGQFHNKKLTKKDRAEAIYRGAPTESRTEIIKRFMSTLDMTAAGAATYYANCKKAFG